MPEPDPARTGANVPAWRPRVLRFAFTVAALAAAVAAGYEWRRRSVPVVEPPDLHAIYSRAASWSEGPRNPVIVIPGFLGSRLVDENGRVLWGAFDRRAASPDDPDDVRRLAVPMVEGVPLGELDDDTTADGVLDTIEIEFAGLATERRAYYEILRTLGVGGYRDEMLTKSTVDYGDQHFNCFQFPYDWRLGVAENAARLDAFMAEKAEYTRRERKRRWGIDDPQVRFDVVAHSMGGLLARYYLRYGAAPLPDGELPEPTWDGARQIDRVVLVAPPNNGSVKSLRTLVDGIAPSTWLPAYPPALVGTFPGLYQLLPRPGARSVRDARGVTVDLYDVESWTRNGWGLLDPDQDEVLHTLLPDVPTAVRRRSLAREHLEKCLSQARRLHDALDRPAVPPVGTTLHLFAGDAIPTASQLGIDADGEPRVTDVEPGDRTVPRASALGDRRERDDESWQPRLVSPVVWTSVVFLPEDHFGLTRHPAFTDNVLYLLLEQPRVTGRAAEFSENSTESR